MTESTGSDYRDQYDEVNEMSMGTIEIPGILEIDRRRGVVYFHSSLTGATVLRICRLPTPIPDPRDPFAPLGEGLLDITHMHGVSWSQTDASPSPIPSDTQIEAARALKEHVHRVAKLFREFVWDCPGSDNGR